MNSEAPVNAGHNFANAAEDFEEREMWLKAAEFHFKAAEQFEIALKDTVDAEATRTLRLLTSNHTRKGNELNRKAQRLIKSAANQRMHQMVGSHIKTGSGGLRHALPEKPHNNNNSLLVSRTINKGEFGEGSHHRTSGIGESYALLSNDDNDDDPFNKFLEAVEGLVDQLFNPAVAFTSAPLDENDNPIPIIYGPTPSSSESLNISRQDGNKIENNLKSSNMMESYYIVPHLEGNNLSDEDYQQLVNKTASVTLDYKEGKSKEQQQEEDYKLENKKLRAKAIQLQKRMKVLEQTAEEGNMLKSSVLQFRDDVHKQAKRIMQSHHESSMRSSAAALMSAPQSNSIISASTRYPTTTLAAAGSHDLISKLKELEAENIKLKAQHEKQNVLVNKYKERWEMLKENAKKRRASTISTTTTPITEENES